METSIAASPGESPPASLSGLPAKKTVYYAPTDGDGIVVGARALVLAPDHPCHVPSAGSWVLTSRVISYDPETGDFETKNTFYKEAR